MSAVVLAQRRLGALVASRLSAIASSRAAGEIIHDAEWPPTRVTSMHRPRGPARAEDMQERTQ